MDVENAVVRDSIKATTMQSSEAAERVIMLVEDDPDISAIAVLALQLDPTLRVVVASSGENALNLLSDSPLPDVFLVDTQLPDMDGVALARLIAERRSDRVPVAFLTAAVRPADMERYEAAGAAAVFAKPFDPLTLASQVRGLLGAVRSPVEEPYP